MSTTIPHGRDTRYTKQGCRCRACTAAHREYVRKRRRIAARRPAEEIPHGVNGYENYSCRCDVCEEANWRYLPRHRTLHGGCLVMGVKGTVGPHGTRTRYTRHRCRCEACTAANTEYQKALQVRLAALPSDRIPHGFTGYSNYRCRCDVCSAAWSAYMRASYQRRKASGGVS